MNTEQLRGGGNLEKGPKPCNFCEIRDGMQESSRIAENKSAFAIVSLEGYPLIIPKTHITIKNVKDFSEEMGESFELAVRMVEATMKALDASGVNLITNFGRSAGQHVQHAHIHVMNRNTGDQKVKFRAPYSLPRAELDAAAEKIKSFL